MSSIKCQIAVVGIGARLPGGVRSCGDFWDILINGVDAVSEIPASRWSSERFLHGLRSAAGRSISFSAGIIDDLDYFDCKFFGISEREAKSMDPQQRLSLELAWEMLENAHVKPGDIAGTNTGVFMGASSMDASLSCSDDPWVMGPFSMTGNSLSIISNRLSYYYDLQGPSMTLDTACSSSLVATFEACKFLQNEGGDYALAGGINSLYSPFPFIGFSKAQMLADHGRCKVFDQDGNGYVRSEGGVVFLLKRLEDAQRDGNVIHAVIKASGSNSDGLTRPGMSYPNIEGQKRLLAEIYGDGGFDPNALSYVEAHGTGTAAGDPTEIGSLGAVLGSKRSVDTPLLVGSVKSSIGHLEPASGAAGMLKSILILKKKMIPPNIHLKSPLDTIDFKTANIIPVTDATPLPKTGGSACIGVNSFGFGGTNAHVLIEEYAVAGGAEPVVEHESAGQSSLFLSARSELSLRGLAGVYAELIGADDGPDLGDLASCVTCERELMEHRLVAQGEGREDMITALTAFARGEKTHGVVTGQSVGAGTKTAFVFSGNGAQWDGMGRELYRDNAVFRETICEIDAFLSPMLGWSLADRFQREQSQEVNLTEVSQPLLFAYQIGLLRALERKGIVPDVVYGHSVGDVTAAFASGALSLEEACGLIFHRSVVQAKSRGLGRMAVVKCSELDASGFPQVVSGEVEVAASNSPNFVTLTGDGEALEVLGKAVKKAAGIFRMLPLDYPFHSRHMDPFKDELLERLDGLAPRKTAIDFISSASGQVIDGAELGAEYWWHNIREKVDFHSATECALKMGVGVFLEIGPNNVLVRFLSETAKVAGKRVKILPTMRQNHESTADFEQIWKQAFVHGGALDFSRHVSLQYRRVELPLYRWDKVNVALSSTPKSTGLLKKRPSHPLLGFRKDGGLFVWENVLDLVLFPYLGDHVVYGDVILPGAAMIEMALAAAVEVMDQGEQELLDVALLRPMPVNVSPAMDVRFSLSAEDGAFRLESRPLMSEEQWTLNAMGRVALKADCIGTKSGVNVQRPEGFGKEVDVSELYRSVQAVGIEFGPSFRPLERAWVDDNRALALLDGRRRVDSDKILFDPCLLDGAFHSLLGLIQSVAGDTLQDAFLPVWFGRVSMIRPGVIKYALATLDRLTSHSAVASFKLLDAEGQVLGSMQECRFIRMRGRDTAMKGQRAFAVDYVPISHPKKISHPTFVPNSELHAMVEKDLEALSLEYHRKAYYEELRSLCQAAILSHLHALLKGALPPGASFTVKDMRGFGGLEEGMTPFIVYLLQFLESYGVATCKDGVWALESEIDLPPAEAVWRSIVEDYPAYLPETVVLGRLGMHLVKLLRGTQHLDEILSYEPGGLLEAFYTHSPSARFQNMQIVRLLEKLRGQLSKGRPLRILEVGTGGGSLFHTILTAMPSEQLQYLCTDKNNDVLEQLKAANPELRHVAFQCLDIEKGLPDGVELGSFDVILASHVLHELDNIEAALGNCKRLLDDNGIMIAVERNPDRLIDIFLGVSQDWWKHSPSPEQPVSALLSMESWEESFERSGFVDFLTICEKGFSKSESYILLARNRSGTKAEESGQALDDTDWVIIEDARPTAAEVALRDGVRVRLDAVGAAVSRIRVSAEAAVLQENPDAVDLTDAKAWKGALQSTGKLRKNHQKFLYLAGFDTRAELPMESFAPLMADRTTGLTLFAQACGSLKLNASCWLVCGGALGGGSGMFDAVPSQAGAWGAARVVANESDGLTMRMIDLHGEAPEEEALDDLVNEILFPAPDMEVLLSGGQRLIPRLVPLDRLLFENDPHTEQLSRISMTFDTPGKLDNLYWKQEVERMPAPDEVLIRVRATGLNFRDVMFAMGMLPAEALEDGLSGPVLGLECSGEIVGVGSGIAHFQVGDEVMCMAGPCFDSHVCVKAAYVYTKPAQLTFEEAATIPVAFSTAYYALKTLADVREGDKVLIHSAAGGVGLAAIQVARYLGAEIYATAGSEEKRDFLKLLGIKHVLDSRSLSFYDKLRELTGDEGVDVVLNSLAGEALFKSLKLLKPFGRFLELGKRDFYSNTPLRMRMLRKNISFFGIDLDEFMAIKPKQARAIFEELITLFNGGEFNPLVYSVYSRSAAVNAFKAMQRGKHIGKLVVTFDELHHGVRTLPKPRYKDSVDSSGSYLVTGGLGGFGLATAKRLAKTGARNLILLSRSGAASAEAISGVAELEASGATVRIVKADVADWKEVKAGLDEALAGMPPLKGVVHSAAILRDCMVANITSEQISAALMAKAVGAWNMHNYTRGMALDFFVMYSSATTVLGNPGQVNYVAANMVLEALAQHRRANGLAAVTYGWGAITDTGMLSQAPEVMESLKKVMGVAGLSSEQALVYMEMSPDDQYTNLFYFNLDWGRVRNLPYLKSTMFNWIGELHGLGPVRSGSVDSAKSILAMSREQALTALVESISIEVAAMLKIPFESMDRDASIAELGLDSLMAVELGLLIEERYGVRVSSFSMNVNLDMAALAQRIYEALLSGGQGEEEAEGLGKTLREKHGIEFNSESVTKVLDSVNTELGEAQ